MNPVPQLDGLTPGRILQPQTVDELSQMLTEEKGSVVPLGAGTQQDYGNPLQSADCAIDLTALNRITEYNPADLTIHFEGGVTLGQLTAALAKNNQFLPLDPWNGSAATMGGIASVNAQGSFRAMGTLRDWVIGMKVVQVDGHVSKTGGRVVKNVTGYDLAKLYTGSLGTLAIIAEISLKLRSAFGKTATAVTQCKSIEAADNLWRQIRKSPLQPVAGEWLGPENTVWLRFGDNAPAVNWQVKNLPAADWRFLEGEEETMLWSGLRDRYTELGPGVMRLVTLPSEMRLALERNAPSAWIAHAVNGILFVPCQSVDRIREIRTANHAMIERAPREWREREALFQVPRPHHDLLRRIKDAFDPEGRLNPGRHVDSKRN